MPTYDYECSSCKTHFEVFQSMKDDPLTTCPQCNGPVKRLIGGGLGVIFKGSGFYTTDYKRSSSSTGDTSKSSNAKSTDKTEPSATAVTSTETKSDKGEKKTA